MATIEYSLSSKKDKTTGKQEILVRFFHGRFNQRGKTNLYGHSDDWDQDRQRFVIPKGDPGAPELELRVGRDIQIPARCLCRSGIRKGSPTQQMGSGEVA